MTEQERKEKKKAYMRDYMRRRRASIMDPKRTDVPDPGGVLMPASPIGRRAIDQMLRRAVMNTQAMTPPPED